MNRVRQTIASKVILTERDVTLLNLMAGHVLLSFSQIHRLLFAGRNHSTVMNRLKRLESSGYISRQRVHRIRHPMTSGEAGVVFQITMRGIKELQLYDVGRPLPEKVPSIHGRQIDHDLFVVEMAEQLKKEFPNWLYANGSFLEAKRPGEPRPDGAFKNPETGKIVTIEVELSLKSADRYREILAAYRIQRDIEKVIYFVGSDTIGRRIASEVKGYNVQSLDGFKDGLFEIRAMQPHKEGTDTDSNINLGGIA